jgi:GBP family porin
MKKSLIALALIGAFSGAAVAQSNVTLYGIVDVNVMWEEGPVQVGTGTAARITQESKTSINSGGQSGSRWGLRGTEALGGGLNAIFALESGYNVDTGTSGQGNRLFGRQAYAGLSGGLGTVVAGRLAAFSSGTGDFDMIGRVDPFATGFGIASAGSTFISMNALRVDNAIAYVSPTFAGFKAGVGYSTNVNGAETAPSSSNVRATLLGANWSAGPFFAAITYDVVNNVGSRPDQKHLQIGGTFDIAMFRLHAAWASQSDIGTVPATGIGTAPPGRSPRPSRSSVRIRRPPPTATWSARAPPASTSSLTTTSGRSARRTTCRAGRTCTPTGPRVTRTAR